MQPSGRTTVLGTLQRIRIWYAILLVLITIFGIRLFYLQVIRHDYYKKTALAGQLKEYQIPASRGIIEAHDGDQIVPLVLNEKRYTLFADPKYITDKAKVAREVQKIIGGDTADYEKKMSANTRYAILAKKLDRSQQEKLDKLGFKGLGTREAERRTYPEGGLAAQLLGFVDDDGNGKYGIEQALNGQLKGQPGQLRAITDAQGVPLVANRDNVVTQPQQGQSVVLTIDVSMQQQAEDILKAGLDRAKSKSGSLVIMDPKTGAIKAMANYPSYNPAEFYKVEDGNLFNNTAVSSPLEVGSTMKPLTAAAALDLGVVNKNTTYYDPSHFTIDNATVTNIEEDGGPGTRSIADILQLSLNTGATWLLMQMGGGKINEQARTRWHDYMTNHYHFGSATGIEQGYEADGSIPDPVKGFGLNIQYANTAFGQGMTATPLQMAAALSSVVNGGTYYQPTLVDKTGQRDGQLHQNQPKVVHQHVVSQQVSSDIRDLMQNVITKNYLTYGMTRPNPSYNIGGKTGTAEIARPSGGYYEDRFNGTFMGFVGGNEPQYVVFVRVNQPQIGGYAGSKAAAPIFGNTITMLINNFGVTPKE